MTVLSIRKFPDDLMRQAKIAALEADMTLQQWITLLVQHGVKTKFARKKE